MNEEENVQIISTETEQDPFGKFLSDLTMKVTPMVQTIVAEKLANDNQFLKKECYCCKMKLNDGATELNVFTGKGFSRYLFCDTCTRRILDLKP